mgnify:CR=1 FL=1
MPYALQSSIGHLQLVRYANQLDKMNDEDYYDTMEYLKGNKTKH